MLRLIFTILSAFLLCAFNLNAQGSLCADAQPFCTDTTINFPAGVNTPDAEPGNFYDCLFTQPNPAWYFLEISLSGLIEIDLSNSNAVDIDFILYGPWNNLNEALLDCGSFTANQVVDCSYSANAAEIAIIDTAIPGEVYVLLITNYSNQPTDIFALSTSSSTGGSNCDVLLQCHINPGIITNTECGENNGEIEGIVITGGDGNYTYNWTDINNTSFSTDLDIYNLASGDYIFNVQDFSGCENSDTFTVVNNSTIDVASISYNAVNYCLNETINPIPNFIGTNFGTFTSNSNLSINSQTGEINLANSLAGNYEIKFVSAGVCPDSTTTNIELLNVPDANFSFAATEYCPENLTVLPNFINSNNGNFSASAGLNINAQTGEIEILESYENQQFSVTHTLTNGTCDASEVFIIDILPQTVLDFSLDEKSCINSNINAIYLGTEAIENIIWNFKEAKILNNLNNSNFEILYELVGIHEVEMSAPNAKCAVNPIIKNIAINELIVEADSTYTIELGESISLNFNAITNNSVEAIWSPDYAINCINCLKPQVSPEVYTNYQVEVTDQNTACKAYKTIAIIVDFQIPYLANIFTPNNDNNNDKLIPIGDFAGFMEFKIFNRWGELVFKTNDPDKGWNGQYKNSSDVNSEVFVWTLVYEIPNGEIYFDKGNVTLLK